MHQATLPGRTTESTLGVASYSSSVAPFAASVLQSRPGPESSCGLAASQSAISGKYNDDRELSLPDTNQIYSTSGYTSSSSPYPDLTLEEVLHGLAEDISLGTPTATNADSSSFDMRSNNEHRFQHPGRTILSTTGAPLSPSTVVTMQPALDSRPGPVVGCGEGVSQPVQSGKYTECADSILPDDLIPSSLRIYYQNVRGLRTKIESFFLAVTELDYDVIVLTETWLDHRILSAQLFGSHYSVFRTDRSALNSNKSRGGGVLIAVSSQFNCCSDPTPVNDQLEQLWVRILLPDRNVSIGVFYLPPDMKNDADVIRCHIESIAAVHNNLSENDLILQFGDYNQSDIYWAAEADNRLSIDLDRSRMCPASSALLDGFCFHGLSQVNTLTNTTNRTLDLVLVCDTVLPNFTLLAAAEALTTLDDHHPAIELIVMCPLPVTYEMSHDYTGFNFQKANFESLNVALMSVDWNHLDSIPDINEAVDFFTNSVLQAVTNNVPPRRPPSKPPWSNGQLRLLRRRRSAALRCYCNNRSQQTKLAFNEASREYRNYNALLYARYKRRTEQNLRTNPKQFWSFINSKRKENGLPTSMYLDEQSADCASDKCELFAAQFQRAFNNFVAAPSQVHVALDDTTRDVFSYEMFKISEQEVASAITKLKLSYTPGPDGIPPALLKRCSALLIPLVKLFNRSLGCRVFPRSWKMSFLFPIHKKGDKRSVSNYRGITSLCVCSKVFEIIINDSLFNSCKQYISSDQHGFFPKRSVTTNLVEFSTQCIRAIDAGKQVDAVYLDLKAAFDRVDHGILLQKLRKCGVSDSFIDWFESYLTNRSLCVKIGSNESSSFTNLSGVPQGSNLGPLLFSLFINDASLVLPPGTRLFYADDTKVYMIVDSLDDCHHLQRLLNDFEAWCSRNCMTLSIEKCQVISFNRKRNPIHFQYTLSGTAIERVQRVRDLGVWLDEEFTFNYHFNDIVSRANKQLGFVLKVTEGFSDPLCLRSLYCALVRSILEFAAIVWCPFHASWITRIESVQRKFLRHALRNLPWRDPSNLPPYEDRCRLLGIDTLENRRCVSQAAFVAKLLQGDIDSPSLLADVSIYAPERNLRRRNFVSLGSRNTLYGQHDPTRYMATKFNEIYHLFDFNITMTTLRNRFAEYFRHS